MSSMKSFYRQKKKADAAKAKPSSAAAVSLGSNLVQPPSLPSPHSHDGGCDPKEEEVLRQFDMNMAYGPCIGMSRLDRWERASRLGLNPPREIHSRLVSHNSPSHSLWDGRI